MTTTPTRCDSCLRAITYTANGWVHIGSGSTWCNLTATTKATPVISGEATR